MIVLDPSLQKKLDRQVRLLFRGHGSSGHEIKLRDRDDCDFDMTYFSLFENKMCLVHAVRIGLPYKMFWLICQYTPFTDNYWTELLNVSSKTLQRYRLSDSHFKPLHSEKILEMAEVTNMGLEVFGDMDKFKLWLNTPSYALGKHMPIDLLKDSFGKDMVMAELSQINHGILA